MIWLAILLAYIPSTGSLMKRAAERVRALGRGREVTLTGTLTVSGQPARTAQLVIRFPLQCRLQADGGTLSSVKGSPPAAEGASGPASQLLQLACPLLAFRGLPRDEQEKALLAAAASAGVDTAATPSISRLMDRAVYVVGAGPRDTSRPQLWLYKDTFAPARVIAQGGAELRLLEYGNPAAGEWFPRMFELWSGDQLGARFEVLEEKGVKSGGEEEEDDSSG